MDAMELLRNVGKIRQVSRARLGGMWENSRGKGLLTNVVRFEDGKNLMGCKGFGQLEELMLDCLREKLKVE